VLRYEDDQWERFLELQRRTSRLSYETGIAPEPNFAVCSYCMSPLPVPIDEVLKVGFHVDHIVPRSRGGSSHPDNLTVSCSSCNLRKGARTPARWYVAERRVAVDPVEEEFPGLVLVALREMYEDLDALPPRRDPSRLRASDGPDADILRSLDARLAPSTKQADRAAVDRFLNDAGEVGIGSSG
jgi:hypothetical protein